MADNDLDELQDDATTALGDVFGLLLKGATPQQCEIAARGYVVAQARYTIACERRPFYSP